MDNLVGWISLGVAILIHLIGTVVWATRMSTLLDVLRKTLDSLAFEMKSLHKDYVGREEFAREMAIIEKEHLAIWKNVDEVKRQHDKDHNK